MKKTFNWLGWLIVFFYITVFAALCYLTVFFFSRLDEYMVACVFSTSAAILMIPFGAAMLPIWYDRSLGKLLPTKKAFATALLPHTAAYRIHIKGVPRTRTKHYITFELSTRERIVFSVSPEVYCTVLQSEHGILTYKAQGKHTYFIDFQRQG